MSRTRVQRAGWLVVLLNVAAFAAPLDQASLRSFAADPEWSLAKLSPDAKRLSQVLQIAGKQIVVIHTVADASARRTLAVDPTRERVRWCGWSGPDYLLCGTVTFARGRARLVERTRLYSIHRSGAVAELNVAMKDPVRDQVIDLAPMRPEKVLLQHDPSGRGYPEVVELDVASGVIRRVVRAHPPIRRWMSDRRGEVVLGIGYDDDAATLHVRGSNREDWTMWLRQSLSDPEAIGPVDATPAGELYALKHHDGRAALYRLQLGAPAASAELVFAHGAYDVSGPIALDALSGELLAVEYVADRRETHAFSAGEASRYKLINDALRGTTNLIVDRSLDGNTLLVRAASDVDPPSLYLFDMRTGARRLIGHDYPELEERTFAPMAPRIYRARDGQPLRAYLTAPVGAEPANLPTVVLPHGGPETRNWVTFDPLVQFLAARGYAVLQMNFRGSFGYGAAFAAAGAGQWGGVIHNDITDGTRWLVAEGVADPTRICIVGQSFGGYAALMGAARESQWYACAASFAGVTDLMAMARYTEQLQDADRWRGRLGEDSRALWQMSPVARVQAIATPILLIHGRFDSVAPIRQARRFARALRTHDKPHIYLERDDCDHEMTIASCRFAYYDALESFLRAHLH